MRRILLLSLAVFAGCGDTLNYYGCLPDGGAVSSTMPDLSVPVTEVLDNEELNIGRTDNIPSLNFVAPNVAPNGEVGFGQEVRLLDVQGSSQRGRQITLALSAFLKAFDNAGIGTAGPVVARIEFGSGAVSHWLEVDVPMGAPTFVDPASPVGAQTDEGLGGVILTVPGSSIRVIVRNDGAALPEDVLGDPVPGSLQMAENASLVTVQVHASYDTRPSLQRAAPRRSMTLTRGAAGLAGGVEFRIPPFARTMRIVRGTAFAVTINDFVPVQTNVGGIDSIVIPAGVPSPEIEVPAGAGSFVITTNAQDVWAEFTIEV